MTRSEVGFGLPDMEAAVLGCVLLDHETAFDIARRVITSDEMFTIPAYREVWRTVCELHDEGAEINSANVAQGIGWERLKELGGGELMIELQDTACRLEDVDKYCGWVMEAWAK